jgi:hypothetical protein
MNITETTYQIAGQIKGYVPSMSGEDARTFAEHIVHAWRHSPERSYTDLSDFMKDALTFWGVTK